MYSKTLIFETSCKSLKIISNSLITLFYARQVLTCKFFSENTLQNGGLEPIYQAFSYRHMSYINSIISVIKIQRHVLQYFCNIFFHSSSVEKLRILDEKKEICLYYPMLNYCENLNVDLHLLSTSVCIETGGITDILLGFRCYFLLDLPKLRKNLDSEIVLDLVNNLNFSGSKITRHLLTFNKVLFSYIFG